jgi:glycosyltransferase involved in cell wall biosynthesis
MNLGMIIYGLDRPLTGTGRYTLELAQALAASKEHVELFLLVAGSPGPLAKRDTWQYITLPGCRLLPGLMTTGSTLLPSLARRYNLDILHDPTGVTPFAFGTGRARAVVTIHDVFPWSCPGNSSFLDNLIYRSWLPWILSKGKQRIITDSQQSRQDIETYLHVGNERLQVIPPGIGAEFKRLPPDIIRAQLINGFGISFPYVLFVGMVTQRKNIARALKAFAQISPEFPDLHFVIAGPRSWKQTPVESIVEDLKISDRIILTGPVNNSDLICLYNGAELFVFPSLYEGFGFPPLEAMACGTPVVISNVSSLPEVAGEAALLVDPYNVETIALAMRHVLSDPALAAELRARGLAQASKYTWERTAKETLDAYQRAMDNS